MLIKDHINVKRFFYYLNIYSIKSYLSSTCSYQPVPTLLLSPKPFPYKSFGQNNNAGWLMVDIQVDGREKRFYQINIIKITKELTKEYIYYQKN